MRHRISQLTSALLAIVSAVVPLMVISPYIGATPSITEFNIPTSQSNPFNITTGPDGALWFTESSGNKIGKITTSGVITEYTIPLPSSFPPGISISNPPTTAPDGITSGPDGALWFTEGATNKIGRITTSGLISEFDIPPPQPPTFNTSVEGLVGITTGPDGALWFTEANNNKIGRITTSGQITEYSIPTPHAGPIRITTGSDGALWFAEQGINGSGIGRITTSGLITEYVFPDERSYAYGITSGSDGALWFTDIGSNKIGRITTSGQITEYPIPTPNSDAFGITSGSDGALWFADLGSNSIGRVTTSGAFSSYSIPTQNANSYGITTGSDGALWFTEAYGNQIGRIPAPVPLAPANLNAASPAMYPSLSWDVIAGAASYNIYRNGVKIDSAAVANYTDNATPEGTQSYYVTAVNSSGESAPSNTVDVFVDRTAPNVVGTPDSSANSNGWYSHDVTINWSSADLSPSSGTPTQPAATLADQEGDHTYTSGQSCDPAGNCSIGSLALKIDKTLPDISYTIAPAPNANGWNNGDVVVTFSCSDATSGVDSCTLPVTLSAEGGNQVVTGTAVDKAGNTKTVTASVNLDKTSPLITYALSQQPNANGWINGPVTVTYTCSDALSDIASCSAPQAESADGSYTLSGTAVDKAGNQTSTQAQVNIDQTAPVVSNLSWSANPIAQGQNTTLSVAASDDTSGVASVYYTIDGGAPHSMTYDATLHVWKDSFGASFSSDVHDIGVFATDYAGNVSAGLMDMLVVSSGSITGHARLLPVAPADVLPIALDTSTHNPTDVVVGFSSANNVLSDVSVDYAIKNNKNEFIVTSNTIDWVIKPDSAHMSVMAHGDLTTYSNNGNTVTVTQNVVVRIDITLGTNGSPNAVKVSVWNPGQSLADAPAYHIDEPVGNGSNMTIQ